MSRRTAQQIRQSILDITAPTGDEACLGAVDIFYPPHNVRDGARTRLTVQARATCFTCRHWETCLQGALERGEENGVWGGVNFNVSTKESRQRRAWRLISEANEIRQARQENAG